MTGWPVGGAPAMRAQPHAWDPCAYERGSRGSRAGGDTGSPHPAVLAPRAPASGVRHYCA